MGFTKKLIYSQFLLLAVFKNTHFFEERWPSIVQVPDISSEQKLILLTFVQHLRAP